MADPKPGQWDIDIETPAKDRATVALVSEQVKGVERLVELGFKDIQRQLDQVSGLPERVTRLEVHVSALQGIAAGKAQRAADRWSWKRGFMSSAVLLLLGTMINLAINGHIF